MTTPVMDALSIGCAMKNPMMLRTRMGARYSSGAGGVTLTAA